MPVTTLTYATEQVPYTVMEQRYVEVPQTRVRQELYQVEVPETFVENVTQFRQEIVQRPYTSQHEVIDYQTVEVPDVEYVERRVEIPVVRHRERRIEVPYMDYREREIPYETYEVRHHHREYTDYVPRVEMIPQTHYQTRQVEIPVIRKHTIEIPRTTYVEREIEERVREVRAEQGGYIDHGISGEYVTGPPRPSVTGVPAYGAPVSYGAPYGAAPFAGPYGAPYGAPRYY